MPTNPTPVSALPSPPDPNNRATFNTLAYPWSVALGPYATQINALGTVTFNNATEAALSAASALALSNAVAWVSGTTYAIGNVVWSPITFLSYRRKTSGAGTTDPSADATNWQLLSVVRETRLTPAISANNVAIDCTANLFAVSLTSNITSFTLSNVPASGALYGFILEFTADGSARTVTWSFSGVTVKWAGGTAPTLTSTNAKKDAFTFYTYDGGATWIGAPVGQNL